MTDRAPAASSLEDRRALLAALAGMVMTQRTQIEEAMSADFGVHPTLATDGIEVLGVAGRAAYVAEQLEGWMTPEPRYSDPAPAWSLRCARCWSSVRTRCAPPP